MFAARSGDEKAVIYLLELLGIKDINAVDEHGSTALALCSISCYNDIAKILIDAGANIFIEDYQGNNALQIGAFYCGGNKPDLGLSYATALLNNDKWTLDDINRMSKNGRTALMLAGKQGGKGFAKVLLDLGADTVPISPYDGKTYEDFIREYDVQTESKQRRPEF